MGTRVVHFDDFDGTEADVKTVPFSFDGVNYRIDLSEVNKLKMAGALMPFIDKAEVVRPEPVARVKRTGSPAKPDKDQNNAIREWARAKGIEVSDRGRIKQEIVDQFNAAHA